MSVKVVISDFGGVLTNPLIESFLVYESTTGIPLETLGEAMGAIERRDGEHPLFELEKGILSETRFTELMQAELERILGRDVHFGSFADEYFKHLHPNEPFIDFLRSLRRDGMPMALLTNNVKEWEPRWRAMLPIDELFEVIVDSGFEGTRKPERRIYEITYERIAARNDVQAHECVLVDDIEINCDAAREFGFQAVQYREADQAIADVTALLSGD